MKIIVILLLMFAALNSAADTRVVIGYPPGGTQDVIVQTMRKVSPRLNVEYRPGAGAVIMISQAAKWPPDGTSVFISTASIANGPLFYPDLAYDPFAFVPIAHVGETDSILVVHPSVPARTIKEFAAAVAKQRGKMSYGFGGHSTVSYYGMERLVKLVGGKMLPVGYKSVSLAPPDLMRGDIDSALLPVPNASSTYLPVIKSGKIRVIASTGSKRSTVFSETPTISETYPGYKAVMWWGIFAPPGTNGNDADRLGMLFSSALSKISVELQAIGVIPGYKKPTELSALVRSEHKEWSMLIKSIAKSAL